MHRSSKARNTGLTATVHLYPDCRDCVVILSTVSLESECTGKDKILITFFEQFFGLEFKKTLFLCSFLQFSQESRARATTDADANVARANKKNTLATSKTNETRLSSLITVKYTWNIKENFEMPSDK